MSSCWDKYQNIFNTNTHLLYVCAHINTENQVFSNFLYYRLKSIWMDALWNMCSFFVHQSNGFALCEFAVWFGFFYEVGSGMLQLLKVSFWQWKYSIKCISNLGYILPQLLYGFNCNGSERDVPALLQTDFVTLVKLLKLSEWNPTSTKVKRIFAIYLNGAKISHLNSELLIRTG